VYLVMLCAGLCATALPAATPPAAPAEAASPPTIIFTLEPLIRSLGAARFEMRERATDLLQRYAQPARPLLEAAVRDEDPEIRLRARRVLDNVALGLSADWPEEATEIVRGYDKLDLDNRRGALVRLNELLGPWAAPFLIRRLGEKYPQENDLAARLLVEKVNPETARLIIASLPEPKSNAEVKVVVTAMELIGSKIEDLRFVATDAAADHTADAATEAAILQLRDQLILGQADDVGRQAAEAARKSPKDARLLYLQAEACAAAGHAAEAKALREQAAAISPNDKAAHAAAAELLESLGCRVQAAAEWKTILRLRPTVAVHDLNARVRLGVLYNACGLGAKAGTHFKAAIDLYESAGVGPSVRVEGGSVVGLRLAASRYSPDVAGAVLTDDPAARKMTAHVVVGIRDGRLEACRRAIAGAVARLRVVVDPPDLGLFDEVPAALNYDPKRRQVALTLEEVPCGQPAALDLGKGTAEVRLAVETPSAWVIFGVSPTTGQARQIERYRKVYVAGFSAPPSLADLSGAAVTVNGIPCSRAALEGGLPFDTLPQEFRVIVTSTPADGRPRVSYCQPPVAEVRDLPATTE
jgi:tetratricopeptide (TPR) repeat protein